MRKVPKLRFKEFSDEWEEKKIEDIGEINPKSKSIPKKFVYIDLESVVDGQLKEKKIIEKEEAPSRAKRLVEKNDILYQMVRPYQQNNLYFSFNDELDYVASTGYAQIRTFYHNNSMYVYHLMHTKKFLDKVLERCTGTSYPAINSEDLSNISIKISKNINEQEKIANFLSSIDKKIYLTEEKLELFREYKKGVMQKIFSQELRFKDSNSNDYPEWEEKKLGEIAFFSKGKLISKEDITEEGVECIRYGELYTIYKEKIEKVVSKTKLEKNKLILSEKNDVIIPSSGETAIDIAVASCVMKDGVALGADLNIIKTKENGLYLAYFINNPAKLELASLAQGASVIHLYEKHLKLLNIKIPTLEEQEKIADFLSSIDSKIESIEKELEGLKEFKKGLLQQMFI